MYSLVPRSFGWSLGGSKCGCRGISSSAIRCREEVSRQPKVTVGEVMRNEERGTFRTLDIGKPKFRMSDEEFQKKLQRERGQQSTAFLQDRELEMSPHQDWQSIWPATRTFQPSVVPLPIRQGYIHLRNQVHPGKYANAELMKIPNFLHLTPPVVRKQAESLRQFCTPFPKGI